MAASRQFVDSFGFSWQALEIGREGGNLNATPSDSWLYFLARGTTRRLQSYPSEWMTLTWSELEDLCTRAEVIGADAGLRPVRPAEERQTAAG